MRQTAAPAGVNGHHGYNCAGFQAHMFYPNPIVPSPICADSAAEAPAGVNIDYGFVFGMTRE
jgi:hypothetical protein